MKARSGESARTAWPLSRRHRIVSDEITSNVVNSAKGDPSYGENSALCASFGYVRKDDRKSGLTRTAHNVVPAPAELKVAA